jgi:hypothetical protein
MPGPLWVSANGAGSDNQRVGSGGPKVRFVVQSRSDFRVLPFGNNFALK